VVDRVEGPLACALVLIALFISLDTFSTLAIMEHGGVELNPVMAWIRLQGKAWFVLVKVLPVVIILPLLASYQFFRIAMIGTRLLLYPYALLAAFHIAVLSQIYS
jgi:hypothetical protein